MVDQQPTAFADAGLDEAFYADLCATAAPPRVLCSFAELLPLFQELFEPDPSRVIALIGRLKFLIKLGAAEGVRAGKGKAAAYDQQDVMELLILMELTQIGLPPAKAIEFYRQNRDLRFPYRAPVGNGSHLQIGIVTLERAARRHLPSLFLRENENV